MKKVMLILFIGFFGLALTAQDKGKAKIEFKTETIDYGEIAKGSDGVRQFEFTNTGDAPLIISKVYSSCGSHTILLFVSDQPQYSRNNARNIVSLGSLPNFAFNLSIVFVSTGVSV